jgi:hypothetical protein
LLKAFEEHSISYQENKYEMKIITDAIKNVFNLKQGEDESLIDYTRRFKSARDVLVAQLGGPIELAKFIMQQQVKEEDETEANPTIITLQEKKDAFEQFMAYLYLENSDQLKYGSLVNGLSSQFSLGQALYPKTIMDANNALSTHRFFPAYAESKKKKISEGANRDQDKQQLDSQDREINPKLSFAQLEGKCYCCGKGGHKSPQCRHKNKPKNEWAINKTPKFIKDQTVMSNASETGRNDAAASTSECAAENATNSKLPFTWMGAQVTGFSMAQYCEEMKDLILLDS